MNFFFFFFPFLFSMLVNFSQEMYVCRSSVDFDERKRRASEERSCNLFVFMIFLYRSYRLLKIQRFDSIRFD